MIVSGVSFLLSVWRLLAPFILLADDNTSSLDRAAGIAHIITQKAFLLHNVIDDPEVLSICKLNRNVESCNAKSGTWIKLRHRMYSKRFDGFPTI